MLVELGPAEHDADHPGCRRPTTRFVPGFLVVFTVFIGFCMTFLVQHWLGVTGMPRRVADYPFLAHLATTLNDISSIGSFILGASTFIFLYNIPAGSDERGALLAG